MEKETIDMVLSDGGGDYCLQPFNFPVGVSEHLGYYVYALVDPRDNRIFYIGKGCGNRVFDHAHDAMYTDDSSLKLDKIREIIKAGLTVKTYIIRHDLTKDEALLVESVLIDVLTYPKFNMEKVLTNIASGYHQSLFGTKDIGEINSMYAPKKIEVQNHDKLLLVSLNRTFINNDKNPNYHYPSLYEAARKFWRVSMRNAKEVDYVLGVYRGVVRIVIKPTKWLEATENEHGTKFIDKNGEIMKRRYCEGEIITDSPYLYTDVTDYPFSRYGGAFRLIP